MCANKGVITMRLTRLLRTRIIVEVLDKGFSAREKALRERKVTLGVDIYNSIYTPQVLGLMHSLPEGFFDSRSRMIVYLAGTAVEFKLDGPRYFGHCDLYSVRTRLSEDSPFSKEWLKLDAETIALMDERDEVEDQLHELLNSVQTVKRLKEVWPEVTPYLDSLKIPHTKESSFRIEYINKTLGVNGGD